MKSKQMHQHGQGCKTQGSPLYAKALPCALAKAHEIFFESLAIPLGFEPSFRSKLVGFGENGGMSQDEVRGLRHRRLFMFNVQR